MVFVQLTTELRLESLGECGEISHAKSNSAHMFSGVV